MPPNAARTLHEAATAAAPTTPNFLIKNASPATAPAYRTDRVPAVEPSERRTKVRAALEEHADEERQGETHRCRGDQQEAKGDG